MTIVAHGDQRRAGHSDGFLILALRQTRTCPELLASPNPDGNDEKSLEAA